MNNSDYKKQRDELLLSARTTNYKDEYEQIQQAIVKGSDE